jgi:hypothetical protein
VKFTASGAVPAVALILNVAPGAAAAVIPGIIIHSKMSALPVNDNFLVDFISDSSFFGNSSLLFINSCRWSIVESWKDKGW